MKSFILFICIFSFLNELKANIFLAIKNNDFSEVKQLIEKKGVSPNVRNKYGDRPLHFAVEVSPDLSEYLIQKGAFVNAKNKYGQTALHVAADSHLSDDKNIKILIENGAITDAKDDLGFIPLHNAVIRRKVKGVKLLLRKKDINSKNSLGNSPFYYAFMKPNLKIAKYLIQKGADINAQNNEGETALMAAVLAVELDFDFIKLLFNHNVRLNLKDFRGQTAFDKVLIIDRKEDRPDLKVFFEDHLKMQEKIYQQKKPKAVFKKPRKASVR